MSETELIRWLSQWVAETTDVASAEEVDPARSLESYGLSSRDAVVLSGELERTLGRRVDPTIAYQHPTILALAKALTQAPVSGGAKVGTTLSLIHISEPTRRTERSRMPSSA